MPDFAKKLKLSNGLSVIFEKNSNAKIVSLNMGVRIGSVHEADHESGLCHLLEHMVFKGSKSFAAGEIATTVEACGGELNAYTSLDQTVYYINLPSEHFAKGLHILKEMVFDALIDADELAREKEVVVEEILRGKDSPQRVLNELVFANFFKGHNYARPVIGTAELVRGFPRDKVYDFYKRNYTPQNMILGICGDVDEAVANAEIEKLFRFEMATPGLEQSHVDKTRKEFRVVKTSMDVNSTYFDLVFPAVGLSHKDVPALDVLSHLLGEGGASLLEQNTKEKEQLVNYVYTASYTPRYTGLFLVGGQTPTPKLQPALASIVKQIHKIKTEPVSETELERVKLLAKSQLIYDKQTCEGTAKKWMNYETTLSNYRYDEEYQQAVAQLTVADIQKVANQYLDFAQCTVAVLHPKTEKPKMDAKIFHKDPHEKRKPFTPIKQSLGVSVHKLDNGVRVLFRPQTRLPLFSVKLTLQGGLRFETSATNGWFQLMANVMTKEFADYDQKQIAEKSEALACNLSAYSGSNSLGLSLTALSEKWQESLQFFTDLALRPTFSADEFQKERQQQLEAIKNRTDNPAQMAFYHTKKMLFGKHPYAMAVMGEAASLKKASPEKLKKLYQSVLVPENMVIAVVGDVERDLILPALNATLGQIGKKRFVTKKHAAPKLPAKIQTQYVKQKKNQAHLVLGFLGSSIFSKDRYALEVLNHVFSGQGGRLFLELRDKQSLAYTVSSNLMEGIDTGFLAVYIGCEPGKAQKAVDGILLELQKACNEKITADELARAKNYIIGNHAIDRQKNSDIAMELALNELYHKPIEELENYEKAIRQVSAADVQAVAKKYLTLEKCVLTVVGPVNKLSI